MKPQISHFIPAGVGAILLLLAGLMVGCEGESVRPPGEVAYSFLVAGHPYGSPNYLREETDAYDGHLHPPFRRRFDIIQQDSSVAFGVFTGDIVMRALAENWDKVDEDIAELGLPVYFAQGNHDIAQDTLFETRYGPTYYKFAHERDLFIVLNPNLDHWNITGDQLAFLREALADTGEVRNLFVFFHQLLWWEPDNLFADITPNSTGGRDSTINFWSEIEPLFRECGHDVYLFAGDVGAHAATESYMYYRDGKIRFIASGMGGGSRDNFIIVSVTTDGAVSFRLVALNDDDPDALGRLEDYSLPSPWTKLLRTITNWFR